MPSANDQMNFRACYGHIEPRRIQARVRHFSLVYGIEYVTPMEVRELTLRFSRTNEETNNEALLVKLDLLEDHRNLAYMRIVAQK